MDCCDRKSRAACAQSFAPWQQATIEITRPPFASTIDCSPGSQALLEVTHQDHSIGITLLLLVRATYMHGVVLHAHPVRGESHNQRNTTGENATGSSV